MAKDEGRWMKLFAGFRHDLSEKSASGRLCYNREQCNKRIETALECVVKVTTEKRPKSLLALDIEIDRAQIEKGLDRAARRISQRVNIPGFRKGKAPRFIVENYFGRGALLEEAQEDLINRTFRDALQQENIEPVGQASLEEVHFDEEPFHFVVTVPVEPTVTLPDYRAIRVPAEERTVTDEMVEQALNERRERHVVLREPDEPRPARQGDQLTVQMETFVEGEPLEEREEGEDVPESTLVLEPDRLIPGLFDGLVGIEPGETREVTVHMDADHENEKVRDKDVTFKATLKRIEERILPEWDELPMLEETEGSLDDLRADTRKTLEENLRRETENNTVDAYLKELTEQTEYDIPDALIRQEAEAMLEEQARSFERYGITLDQMLQFRNQTRDDAINDLLPQAEERLKTRLALREIVRAEGFTINNDEIDAEVNRIVESYDEQERDTARNLLSTQLRSTVANSVLDQKLRERLFAIATGTAPELETPAAQDTAAEAGEAASSGSEPSESTDTAQA
jgi:trigger factor